MSRIELFESIHQKALLEIDGFLNSEKDYDKDTKYLIKWLLKTEHNPYSIFHDLHMADCMYSSTGFLSLCHNIHHALVDDGDICFPVINNRPYISFEDRGDTKVQWFSEADLYRVEHFGHITGGNEIYFLKDVHEFVEAFELNN